MIHKVIRTIVLASFLVATGAALFPASDTAEAVTCRRDILPDGTSGETECFDDDGNPIEATDSLVTDFEGDEPNTVLDNNKAVNIEDNVIYKKLLEIVNFLSVGVGIVATISVAIAGIQYTTSRGEPGKTTAAINRLTQAGIAIFLYVFGWIMLNWLVPGGVL